MTRYMRQLRKLKMAVAIGLNLNNHRQHLVFST